jgi:hypothetical protein
VPDTCSASAAGRAAADRMHQAFGATDTTGLLSDGGAPGSSIELDMQPVQQSRVMQAEQRINAELATARKDLQQLSRLQAQAQEVRSRHGVGMRPVHASSAQCSQSPCIRCSISSMVCIRMMALCSDDAMATQWPSCSQDLFGTETGKAWQIDSKRTSLREAIRRIHSMIVALPSQADAATREVAERIKRAKATALNEIAQELNRQEIQDLQAKAHKGALAGARAARMATSSSAMPSRRAN